MSANFIHLKTCSSYSLAQSTIKIPDMIQLAKNHNMDSLAICDIDNMFGSLEFSLNAKENNIQPIIGAQIPVKNNINDKHKFYLNLYAKNNDGYSNLLKITSKLYINEYNLHDNFITFSDLAKNSSGIIALSGAEKGESYYHLIASQKDLAVKNLDLLSEVFKDHFYIEFSRHSQIEDCEYFLLEYAYNKHLPIVATNPVFFADPTMQEAQDALMCIANGTYILTQNRPRALKEAYFKSSQEMQTLFSDLPEALNNTLQIAERCSVMSKERAPMLPNFTNEERDEADELRLQAQHGLEEILAIKKKQEKLSNEEFKKIKEQYQSRLDFELDVIIRMQFPGYFLIVSDFIKWSKENNIPVGPGRGSGAGSLVAWCLKITDIDPLRFGLLFERFLNPERISMPDFDIDFCQERRDEVIDYVRQKYGNNRVAQIITFGKLQARAVLRDVGRVMQMPYGQVDRISKMVPNNPTNPVTLAEAITIEPDLEKAIKNDQQVNKMVEIALKLEGLYRHASTHAAGVVIGDKPLSEIVALYSDRKSNMPVVQYSMKYAEQAGLVKFDFLGLKTLTVIQHTVNLLAEQKTYVDIRNLPYFDKETFEMLTKGDAVGVFQFESRGMRDTLRKLKPDSIEDLIALGALYRPGPMDNIPSYIARKHGLEKPEYIHPLLEEILQETFGVIIYQEQVMQLAQILAGYSLGAADLLRRAMGKKIKSEMNAQREIFVKGAINNNIPERQASEIFDLVAKFASYGFNKSHAAAYGLISYQTAFLKANYRIEFIIANLNLELDNTDKIALFIQEAKNGNIDILPPDINKSSAKFTIEFYNNKKAIRYGLAAIKNVGIIVIKDIAKEREMRGDFENLVSFVERNSGANLNKKIYENLAKAGAFDNIHANRQQIIENIEYIISYAEEYKINKNSNQLGLFAVDDGNINKFELRPIKKSSNLQQVADEFKVFGFYLHNHPLDQYKDFLVKLNLNCYEDIIEHKIGHKETCLLAVVPQELMIRSSAKGRFAYLSVSDQSSSFEVAIFEQKLLDENRYYYEDNHPLLLKIDVLYNEENSFRLIVKEVQYLMDHILNHHNNILINADKADFLDVLTNCGAGNHKLKLVLECNNKIVKAEINNGLNFRAMHYYKILQIVNKIKLEE